MAYAFFGAAGIYRSPPLVPDHTRFGFRNRFARDEAVPAAYFRPVRGGTLRERFTRRSMDEAVRKVNELARDTDTLLFDQRRTAANKGGKPAQLFPFQVFPSLKLPLHPVFIRVGAGEGNRTLVTGIVVWCGCKWLDLLDF